MLHVSPAPEKLFPFAVFWDLEIMVYSKLEPIIFSTEEPNVELALTFLLLPL